VRKLIAGIAALLTASAASATAQPVGSKQINYRGRLVEFSIPAAWVEEYEPEGGGTFYEPGDGTGTLRLNVISARPPTSDTKLTSDRVLAQIGHPASEILPNGNAISTRVSRETEQGTPLITYWWYVANVVSPTHVRIANFSYTILSSNEGSALTKAELSFLEKSIRNASFSAEAGK
jgi:hypothetical protein